MKPPVPSEILFRFSIMAYLQAIGGESRSADTYNTLNAEAVNRTKEASIKAWSKSLRGDDAAKYVTQQVGEWYRGEMDKAYKTKSEDFGANIPGKPIQEGLDKTIGKGDPNKVNYGDAAGSSATTQPKPLP